MLNYNTKRIDPKILLLMLILLFACMLSFKNYVNFTYCLQYQIAECPDNLNLNSYSIEAENDEEAYLKIENILKENNFEISNYNISIKDAYVRIVEAETTLIEETAEPSEVLEEETPENIIIEEIPKGGIALLIDYIADKKITLTNGNEIYLPTEIKNNYKYIFIMNGTTPAIYLFNNYEITTYGTSGRPSTMKITEAIRLTTTETFLAQNKIYQAVLYEEVNLNIESYFKAENTITNFNLFKQDGTLLLESQIIEKEPETPTDPEAPTDPETPEQTITINMEEVVKNLEELQKINMCIIIMLAIMFIYTFTRSLFGR